MLALCNHSDAGFPELPAARGLFLCHAEARHSPRRGPLPASARPATRHAEARYPHRGGCTRSDKSHFASEGRKGITVDTRHPDVTIPTSDPPGLTTPTRITGTIRHPDQHHVTIIITDTITSIRHTRYRPRRVLTTITINTTNTITEIRNICYNQYNHFQNWRGI